MNAPSPKHAPPLRIFLSAAEPSGDLHAASLIRAIRAKHPDAVFVGVAGPKMQAQGCVAIADMTAHAAMLTGVVGSVRRAVSVLGAVDHEFSHHRYDAVVVLDSPMLNLPIALRAKLHNLPVLCYIAPQLWAWGAWRVYKIRARVDRLAVVLPFEEEFFRAKGFVADFVGHPRFDALHRETVDEIVRDRIRGTGQPVVAVLPGSRRHVIREVLPGQLEVAAAIRDRHPRAHVGISVADDSVRELIEQTARRSGVACALYTKQNAELLSAADLTLVASGTATLEVAYRGSPMIVMYNGSKTMYRLIGRWLITTKYLSLVNILAQREVVPEFMPYYDSTVPIARAAIELLDDADRQSQMRGALADVIAPLNRPGASARAADILLSMIRAAH